MGSCERGEACTFRHVPWASAKEATLYYASRDEDIVELSEKHYKMLHRDYSSEPSKYGVGGQFDTKDIVEREIQVEMYGANVLKMMEKMGYKPGRGLGKHEQGDTKLPPPCLELESASQKSALGLGLFSGSVKFTAAERSARIADARAQKRQRLEVADCLVHNLMSSDEETDDETQHLKVISSNKEL